MNVMTLRVSPPRRNRPNRARRLRGIAGRPRKALTQGLAHAILNTPLNNEHIRQ
jgi:hypothetical protein